MAKCGKDQNLAFRNEHLQSPDLLSRLCFEDQDHSESLNLLSSVAKLCAPNDATLPEEQKTTYINKLAIAHSKKLLLRA